MADLAENNDMTKGDFCSQTDLKVFIDVGHDTLKATRIFDNDFYSMLNHFEVPTTILPDLVKTQREVVRTNANVNMRHVNSAFKFFKQNVNQLIERVIRENTEVSSRTYYDRPMQNGIIQSRYMQDFEAIWKHMGQMLVQSLPNVNLDDQDASWHSVHSRLMMTDPSFTMAANDPQLMEQANKQRENICETVFESMQVSEFSLIPAQLPMMMSELQMDGFVVDIGHEMTQIVPIFEGMTDIRKVTTFPVGGSTMDAILQRKYSLVTSLTDKQQKDIKMKNLFINYALRYSFKEDMNRKREQKTLNCKLPDGQSILTDWTDQDMNPIDCYLSQEVYSQYFDKIITPLYHCTSSPSTLLKKKQAAGREYPPQEIKETTLSNKIIEEQTDKYHLTNQIFKTIRDYCDDEEIKDFEQIKNISIFGGGSLIGNGKNNSDGDAVTLGELLVDNIKSAILAESVTGLGVTLSQDPRLAVLQGARVLMNLSSNQKQFVSSDEYFENGKQRFLINQILI